MTGYPAMPDLWLPGSQGLAREGAFHASGKRGTARDVIPTPLYRRVGSEHRVDGGHADSAPSMMNNRRRGIDVVCLQMFEQILGRLGVLDGALAQRQQVFANLDNHSHNRSQYALIARVHAVDVDDQQINLVGSAVPATASAPMFGVFNYVSL